MPSYRVQPPKPRTNTPLPAYPRLLGLGLLALAAGCGGNVTDPGATGTGGTSEGPDGDIAPPYEDAGGSGGTMDSGGVGGWGSGGGGAGAPYDGGYPVPDAAAEAELPPPTGAVEAPFDAGEDGWTEHLDAGEVDAELGGAAPAPWDAESCETSIPVP